MKNLARRFVCWPGIDQDVEETVKQCDLRQRSQQVPGVAPLQPWEWPEHLWARLHVNYAGRHLGHMFLATVIQDAVCNTHTSKLVVSDNGSMFTSSNFRSLLEQNGFVTLPVTPLHPATNGLADGTVQTFKEFTRKPFPRSLQADIFWFLLSTLNHSTLNYRGTPS